MAVFSQDVSAAVQSFRSRPPILLRTRSSNWFITLAVCFAVFTDVFLYAVIVPVIPFALESRVGLAASEVQHWVSILLAVYGAALLVAAPIFGVLADRIRSRQAPLLAGLVVLLGATVMFCFGKSLTVLVVARVLQGASAGVVWVVALALLSDTVGKEASGQAMGFVAASYSAGTILAPFLGGIVYREGGYFEVFGMCFGVVGTDIVLRLAIIEKHRARKWQDGVVEGGPGFELAEDTNTTARVPDDQGKRADEMTVAPTVASRKGQPTFVVLIKSRRLQAAWVGTLVVSMTMTGLDATLPLFVNRMFGWDSLGAGLIFIALLIPHMFGPIIGRTVDKIGPRWIATFGAILLLPFWVLFRLVDHNSIRQIVLMVVLLLGIGVATALLVTSLMSEFSKVCDSKEKKDANIFRGRSAYSTSYGIFNISWAAGALLGPLMAAGIERSAGWKTMTWCFGLTAAACLPFVVLFTGGLITTRRKADPTPSSNNAVVV
ncbi:putative MFS-type transporter [Cyphellophora attinorum]|uniref:Putative MFS-type transporter n=1 Tax=Cyphellophora attinorum TaxID=1664694 RepID=A0A0N0NP45_9EURO|nr:putative MFS-type transporter [Phialophora attinorum]KPI42109.1 putative MFS-type transporter [Phialophora attinorum]